MAYIQTAYRRRPAVGHPGLLARSEEIHIIEWGRAYVASGGNAIQPGQPLFRNRAQNGFSVPTAAAEALRIVGICSYLQASIQDADGSLSYSDGEDLRIGTVGTFWITAGAAMKWGDNLYWDTSDSKWKVLAATPDPAAAYAQATAVAISARAGRLPITCVSPQDVAEDGIAEARFGIGYVH